MFFYNNYFYKNLQGILEMDNQATIEKYVTDINNELADAQSLNPAQIVTKMQTLVNTGFQNFFIQTIRNCIQHYSRDRAIIKYAYVIDKLLKLPVFNQIVQNVIVQFYCDIFIFLLIQKCYNQLDELKILRKFWLKTIHPRHLQIMRDIILAETTLDIDQYFKAEIINHLKNHYQKKLRLTTQQMHFHLPKSIKTSNAVYDTKTIKVPMNQSYPINSNYIISQPVVPLAPTIVNPNLIRRSQSPQTFMNPVSVPSYRTSPSPDRFLNPQMRVQAPRNSYVNQPRNFQYPPNIPQTYPNYQRQYPQTPSMQNRPSYPNQFQYPPQKNQKVGIQILNPNVNYSIPNRYYESKQTSRDPRVMNSQRKMQVQVPVQQMFAQQQNIPFYGQRKEYFNDNLKRQRLYSEETRVSNPPEYITNPLVQNNFNQPYFKKQYQQIEPQPHKKIHYSERYENDMEQSLFNEKPMPTNMVVAEKVPQKPKHQKILQKLKNDKLYKCKQCGRYFKNMNEYEKHSNQHFEERLGIKEKRKRGQKLMNIDEWTLNKFNSTFQQFDQFYITVSNLKSSNKDEQNQSKTFLYFQEQQQNLQQLLQQKQPNTNQSDQYNLISNQSLELKCKLCNQKFDLKFNKNQWILNNATFCLIDGEKIPFHKTCQEVLEDSSSGEFF